MTAACRALCYELAGALGDETAPPNYRQASDPSALSGKLSERSDDVIGLSNFYGRPRGVRRSGSTPNKPSIQVSKDYRFQPPSSHLTIFAHHQKDGSSEVMRGSATEDCVFAAFTGTSEGHCFCVSVSDGGWRCLCTRRTFAGATGGPQRQ